MSDGPQVGEGQREEGPGPLPTVTPPSASFFVQLFIVPALIVFGVMLVWFLFSKLAGSGRSVEEYVQILRSSREDRWQAAHDLSHLLRVDSTHARNPRLAILLTIELHRALEAPGGGEPALQEYLSAALGCFDLPAESPEAAEGAEAAAAAKGSTAAPGRPPLDSDDLAKPATLARLERNLADGDPSVDELTAYQVRVGVLRGLGRAAEPERHQQVRLAAIFSLALLAERGGRLHDPAVRDRLVACLAEPDAALRSRAAFALGFSADAQAIPLLVAALDDPDAMVRYNAANALGSLGSEAGLQTYREMLQLDASTAGSRIEGPLATSTILSAVRTLKRLHQARPDADLRSLADAVRALTGHSDPRVRTEATELCLLLGIPASRG